MSWVGCAVGPLLPLYKGNNTLERFLLRGVVGEIRGHSILNMRSLPDPISSREIASARPNSVQATPRRKEQYQENSRVYVIRPYTQQRSDFLPA